MCVSACSFIEVKKETTFLSRVELSFSSCQGVTDVIWHCAVRGVWVLLSCQSHPPSIMIKKAARMYPLPCPALRLCLQPIPYAHYCLLHPQHPYARHHCDLYHALPCPHFLFHSHGFAFPFPLKHVGALTLWILPLHPHVSATQASPPATTPGASAYPTHVQSNLWVSLSRGDEA